MFKHFFSKNFSKRNVGLVFTEDLKVKFSDDVSCDKILEENFNGLWLDIDKIKKLVSNDEALGFVVLSHWKCCFLNCLYCSEKKTDDLLTVKHFDIMPVIKQLVNSGLINRNTKIIFNCGDAALHPEFDKIMYFFINYEMKDIVIHTSAMRYCHSIAEAVGKNIAKVVISLDCGCPYIYERVKGINKFDIAIANIKRYIEFAGKLSNQIIINYTLVQGINDNQKEILDWFMFTRNLGIKKFSLDIDDKWYNSLNEKIPDYLEEILVFVRELSEFNNIEIDFSSKLKKLKRN